MLALYVNLEVLMGKEVRTRGTQDRKRGDLRACNEGQAIDFKTRNRQEEPSFSIYFVTVHVRWRRHIVLDFESDIGHYRELDSKLA